MKSLLRKILIGLSRAYFGRNLVTKDILSVEGGGLRKYKILQRYRKHLHTIDSLLLYQATT